MKNSDKLQFLIVIIFMIVGLICIIGSFITLPGCMTTGGVCEHAPEGQSSVICKATNAVHVSPENLSKLLIITNFAALEKNRYTAEEAMTFVETAEEKLIAAKGLNTLTYGDVVNYLITTYDGLSPAARAVFTIVDPLSSLVSMDTYLPELLSDFDIDLLLTHLSKQKDVIKLYL